MFCVSCPNVLATFCACAHALWDVLCIMILAGGGPAGAGRDVHLCAARAGGVQPDLPALWHSSHASGAQEDIFQEETRTFLPAPLFSNKIKNGLHRYP